MGRERYVFEFSGECPICEDRATFKAERDDPIDEKWHLHWFRGSLRCTKCNSLPRERALVHVLEMFFPNWRSLSVHESSPGRHGASPKLRAEAGSYVETQYDAHIPFGTVHPARGYRSENLECQTFADESFDLVITQDVFEHIFHPDRAIREITRTLKPGGAHVMTVPLVHRGKASERRAELVGGEVRHLKEPAYHGNPIDAEGALVTIDWGYDIAGYLAEKSGLTVSMICVDDLSKGIRALHSEVFVCMKAGALPSL